MADEQYCHDTIAVHGYGSNFITVVCGRLVVTAKGVKVEHIHHHRDLEIPECEQARVSWTRRR